MLEPGDCSAKPGSLPNELPKIATMWWYFLNLRHSYSFEHAIPSSGNGFAKGADLPQSPEAPPVFLLYYQVGPDGLMDTFC